MAELNFTISVNNQQVMRKLAEIQSEMRRTTKIAEEKPSASNYVDVASSAWYADAVKYVADKGLMSGTGDKKFSNLMSHSEQCSAVRRKPTL